MGFSFNPFTGNLDQVGDPAAVVPADLISVDADNALVEGTDDKLFVPEGGGITNSAGANVVPVTIDGNGNQGPSRITDDGTNIGADSGAGSFEAGDKNSVGNGSFLTINDPLSYVRIGSGLVNFANIKVDDANATIEINPSGGISTSGYAIFTGGASPNIQFSATDGAGVNVSEILLGGVAKTLELNAGGNTGTLLFTAPTIKVTATVTAAGTTGARTINKSAGSVNFAAGAQTLVVTNSTVTTSSIIICTVATDDATALSCKAIAGSGSFTLKLNATATAETRVNFWVITPQ